MAGVFFWPGCMRDISPQRRSETGPSLRLPLLHVRQRARRKRGRPRERRLQPAARSKPTALAFVALDALGRLQFPPPTASQIRTEQHNSVLSMCVSQYRSEAHAAVAELQGSERAVLPTTRVRTVLSFNTRQSLASCIRILSRGRLALSAPSLQPRNPRLLSPAFRLQG